MTTIKDVSKIANVSVATVSRVLNNNGYVKEATKKKVLAAIEQLNYRPNDVARSLFKGKSKMIALFVPDIRNPFFPELARAVEDNANAHNYTFILCNTDNNSVKELTYLNALLQKSIDGIVIVSNAMSVKQLMDIKVPIVALDRKPNAKIPSVTVNNWEGAIQAVQHLKESGCKRIGHISGPQDTSSARDRTKGYLAVVEEESWFSEDFIQLGNYTYEEAFEAAKNLLTTLPNVDGIFAANDMMAIGALKAAEHLGINVPSDLSIIGFDGIQMGSTTSPALTTMEQPLYTIGKRATEMLLQKIEKPEKELLSEEYKVTLIQRSSTKERR